jgi:ATP-dependent helicase/nuclease subunit A
VTAALEIGRAFAVRWEARKAREGLLDFSDLIRKAAHLLGNAEAADWIRYKLDRHFDHILIDEAQDTNQSQWDIVEALIDDFFSGEGARGRQAAHHLHRGRLQAGDLRLSGHQPGKLRPRQGQRLCAHHAGARRHPRPGASTAASPAGRISTSASRSAPPTSCSASSTG